MMFKLLLPLTFLALPVMAESDWNYFKDVTVMNLSAEARETVTQDRVKATLRIEHEAKTPEAVQTFINTNMARAMTAARTASAVKVTTGRYNVNKRAPYDRDLTQEQRDRRTTWLGQQTLVLDSADKKALLKLAGALQASGFAMQNLNYYLSREKSDSYKEKLTKQALKNVKLHAKSIADELNADHIHFARIDFNNTMPRPIRMKAEHGMMMAKAMTSDAMPEPTVAAGESDVVITVHVEVHLGE